MRHGDSVWRLSVDLWSARALVWIARGGREGDLAPDTHLYFFDRYARLADCHRARGRLDKARRFQAKADEHYAAGGGDDGPPYAAAMAMPRPARYTFTRAMSGQGPESRTVRRTAPTRPPR